MRSVLKGLHPAPRVVVLASSVTMTERKLQFTLAARITFYFQFHFKTLFAKTSNDIIAGNGRILKVYMNIVCLYLSKKLYYVHELFFIFPSDAYSTTPAFQPLALGRGMAIRVGSAIRESSCSYNILLEIFKHYARQFPTQK